MKKWVPIGTILSLCFSYLPMALTKPLHLSISVPKDLQDNAFGSRFTTITEEQLKHQYISTFTDALQSVPGLNIGQSGSIGGLSSVWIRGAESNHFALFINDIEIPRFSGSPDLSKIPSNQIERIIITRGPQGDLSGAAAGAIHIYTYNKAFSTKDSVLTVRAGHTTSLSLHLENATDTTTVQSRLSYQQDQGWDASLDLNGQKDGARHFALSLNTTHALQSSLLVSANMLYANITSEFDNISPGCGSTGVLCQRSPLYLLYATRGISRERNIPTGKPRPHTKLLSVSRDFNIQKRHHRKLYGYSGSCPVSSRLQGGDTPDNKGYASLQSGNICEFLRRENPQKSHATQSHFRISRTYHKNLSSTH